jgi:hypothetical protein
MSHDLLSKLDDLLDDFGIELTPAQRARAAAKFDGTVSAASSEKFLIAEAVEAASASGHAHVRETGCLASALANRNLIDLNCDELTLNRQLASSKMSIADRMHLKNLLYKIGAVAP